MRTGRSLTVCRRLLPGGGRGACLLRGSAPRGCLLPGGVCSWGGWCLLLGGVCSQEGVCSGGLSAPGGCLLPGVSAPEGGYALGGSLLLRGCLLGYHTPRADTPPVNRMTNRCKNITLATTPLRPVKMLLLD